MIVSFSFRERERVHIQDPEWQIILVIGEDKVNHIIIKNIINCISSKYLKNIQ